MNYDYSVKNADPNGAFLKRALIYLAILGVTISLALTILFILFEIYPWLGLSLGILAVCVLIMVLLGRKATFFRYHLSENELIVTSGNGKEYHFLPSELILEKNAEKSDFILKNVTVLSFEKGIIVTKNMLNQDTSTANSFLVKYREGLYVLAFDDYVRSLLFKEKNEDTLL